jgi:hypothetical protein
MGEKPKKETNFIIFKKGLNPEKNAVIQGAEEPVLVRM